MAIDSLWALWIAIGVLFRGGQVDVRHLIVLLLLILLPTIVTMLILLGRLVDLDRRGRSTRA